MASAASHLPPDEIRRRFSQALSRMYRAEVPAYGTLLDLVAEVNRGCLAARHNGTATAEPALSLHGATAGERLDEERHGAIRVGTAQELALLRRLFAQMGMHPVGYYDLSVAGLPVHSTAFRPIDTSALAHNAFRVFTSLLRLELLEDAELRDEATALLATRSIFPAGLAALLDRAEAEGGLDAAGAAALVDGALEVFRWQDTARASHGLYRRLLALHPLIADVVCFRGPHINHLTPRTLDIEAIQAGMPRHGIAPKASIEGPPARRCPILLRQTSFKALEEEIRFPDSHGAAVAGTHTARFGEVEQRGVALTPAGRALYDRLLGEAMARQAQRPASDVAARAADLAEVFQAFPDDWDSLRRQELAWFHYRLTPVGEMHAEASGNVAPTLDQAIAHGWVHAEPILYEDFLPVSAAGIFRSNLREQPAQAFAGRADPRGFEDALGASLHDEQVLYAQQSAASAAAVRSRFHSKAKAS